MRFWKRHVVLAISAAMVLAIGACTPAAPAPPEAPPPAPAAPKEPAAPKPAEPAAKPAEPAAKPAEPAPKPAEPKPEAKPSYFDGEEVTIIVGASPGGAYDLFARIFARFAADHMEGTPRFTVQNIPGGGHLQGLRTAMQAQPDGRTLHVLHPRWVQSHLLGEDVPDFDVDTVNVIGSPSGGATVPRLWCMRSDVATSWEEIEALGRPVTNGATAPGGSFGLGPQFIDTIGGPVRMVYGYDGTSEIMAAFDRGELDASDRCTEENVPRLFPEWLDQDILAPIFWWEAEPPTEWLQQLGVDEVPHLLDAINATPVQRETFDVMIALASMDRIFVTGPDVPDDVADMWRETFAATVQDERFVEVAREGGAEVGLATAEDFHNAIDGFARLSPEGVELYRAMLEAS